MEEQLKQALRQKLQALTKDELIELLANVTSVYVAMNILSRINMSSTVQRAVDDTQFNLLSQKVTDKDIILEGRL